LSSTTTPVAAWPYSTPDDQERHKIGHRLPDRAAEAPESCPIAPDRTLAPATRGANAPVLIGDRRPRLAGFPALCTQEVAGSIPAGSIA
jgi:hypothetical protein